ncbi:MULTISPECIES: ABC transporter permease [Rhizobiaceae]|uniref:ABC transporter permease n=1 Tax=Rhizobiaceae TaxID=82115 RepID=UPI00083D5991|nr:ABC transporter permease [Sinorhizobium sp. RAC02]AOF90631.1 amino ABC transporter, permease, 3-TM region, His/Glu/Gln/Arg/opine family domain protein [Sinorhizobium sp. RAC02]
MDIVFLWETFLQLLAGIPLTLNLALVSTALGAVLAVLLTLMRMSSLRPVGWVAQFYVFVFRGTPLLVQMFVIYYGLGQFRPSLQSMGLWVFFREPYWCAIFALSLNTAAYGSEILRGGLQAVPHQQVEAARASGMWGFLLYRRIIFPIALRQALPAYASEVILMIKATSLASVITMLEVTGLAAKLISQSYRALEVFLVAGFIYLALNFAITRLVAFIEWRLSPHLRPVPTPASSGAALQHA